MAQLSEQSEHLLDADRILYGDAAPVLRSSALRSWDNPAMTLTAENTGTTSRWFKDRSGWVGTDLWTAKAGKLPDKLRPGAEAVVLNVRNGQKLTQLPLSFFDEAMINFIARAGVQRGAGLETVELLHDQHDAERISLYQYRGDRLILVSTGLEVAAAHLAVVEQLSGPGSWLFDPRQRMLYFKEEHATVISGMVRCN